MSILIKGMSMPKSCFICFFSYVREKDLALVCAINGANADEQKPINCPLVEIPTPHGRLIDADALDKELRRKWNYGDNGVTIANAPTILEAENK